MKQLIYKYMEYLEMEGKSRNTIRNYAAELERFAACSDKIDDKSVEDFYFQRGASMSSSARGLTYAALNGFFKFLLCRDLLEKNPLRKINPPKSPDKTPRPMSGADSTTIEQRIAEAPLRYRLAFRLIRSLALRASEMSSLDVESFDLNPQDPTVRIVGKGGKVRVLPLSTESDYFKDLEEYLTTHPSMRGPLFPSDKASRESYRNFLRKWNEFVSGDIDLHQLRHTKATSMINKGASLRDVQVFLGHSSPNTTIRYTLAGEETKQRLREFV